MKTKLIAYYIIFCIIGFLAIPTIVGLDYLTPIKSYIYKDESSLFGVDDNNDGMRDSLDSIISHKDSEHSYEHVRNLMIAMQSTLKSDLSDIDEVREIKESIDYHRFCSFVLDLHKGENIRLLKNLIFNTSERIEHHEEFLRLTSNNMMEYKNRNYCLNITNPITMNPELYMSKVVNGYITVE